MKIESKFSSLFLLRILFGSLLFIILSYFCVDTILHNQNIEKFIFLVPAFLVLFFLVYVSYDLLKLYKLTITEKGIDKVFIFSNQKEHISFNSILSIEQERTRIKSSRGYVTDGYFYNILELKNGESLLISPDRFENYNDLITAVRDNLKLSL